MSEAADRESDSPSTERPASAAWEEAKALIQALIAQAPLAPAENRDLNAWEREKSFIAERMAAGSVTSRRRWNREELYEERLARYGRKDPD